jgi:hypothetical protein
MRTCSSDVNTRSTPELARMPDTEKVWVSAVELKVIDATEAFMWDADSVVTSTMTSAPGLSEHVTVMSNCPPFSPTLNEVAVVVTISERALNTEKEEPAGMLPLMRDDSIDAIYSFAVPAPEPDSVMSWVRALSVKVIVAGETEKISVLLFEKCTAVSLPGGPLQLILTTRDPVAPNVDTESVAGSFDECRPVTVKVRALNTSYT